jgi:lysyl-tRNA synthetase class 2
MNACSFLQQLKSGVFDPNIFRIRAKVLQSIRNFFNEQGFLEIESPILTPYPTLDNHIESIECTVNIPSGRRKTLYLHTSPEHALKKLISAGSGPLFYAGKVFRNNELTHLHNPEFTMVEWYRLDADYRDIMNDTQSLVCQIARSVFSEMCFQYGPHMVDLSQPWKRKSLAGLFQAHFAIDPGEMLNGDTLKTVARQHRIHFREEDDWETLFHRLFMAKIEPDLGCPEPVFITDFPVELGLMAKRKADDSRWVERAELYIAGLELSNGYSELTDPEEQLNRFESQHKLIKTNPSPGYPIDYELIGMMKERFPSCAGMALGIDRLLMFFLNKTQIQEVILFPVEV